MALLTNKQTEQDLKERLEEFLKFGMTLKYMLDIGSIDLSDIEKIFFDSDREKATLIYSRLLKAINPDYLNQSYTIYSHEYPNEECLEAKEYSEYLNRCCISDIISNFSNSKNIDKTYYNTYNYLLNTSESNKKARK